MKAADFTFKENVKKEKSIFHTVRKKAFKILTHPFNLAVVKTIRRKGIKRAPNRFSIPLLDMSQIVGLFFMII